MRLVYHAHDPSDGTAWYRLFGPLGHLRKISRGVQVEPIADANVATSLMADVAFFQRPCTYREVEVMRIFKRAGVPVVVDFDDDLLNYPNDLPGYFQLANPDIRNAVLFAMQEATAVLVSTPPIRDFVKRFCPEQRVYVIPNALDPALHREPTNPKTEVVFWRGTNTHQRDLYTFREQFRDLAAFDKSRVFQFMGFYPWYLDDVMPKAQFEVEPPQSSVANYIARLHQIAPRFGVVPLCENVFNKSKSNIAWLELTWAGAVCVVPQWPEWIQPGVVTYDPTNPPSFFKAVNQLLEMPREMLDGLRMQSWRQIQKKYTLDVVNPKRLEIFRAAHQFGVGGLPKIDKLPDEWPAEEEKKDSGLVPINPSDPHWRKAERALEEVDGHGYSTTPAGDLT